MAVPALALALSPGGKGLTISEEIMHLEKLRKEFTNELVTLNEARPGLERFQEMVGRVVTVDAAGQALVQFNGFPARYAIGVDHLRVVDQTISLVENTDRQPGPRLVPVNVEYEPSELEKARLADGKAS